MRRASSWEGSLVWGGEGILAGERAPSMKNRYIWDGGRSLSVNLLKIMRIPGFSLSKKGVINTEREKTLELIL